MDTLPAKVRAAALPAVIGPPTPAEWDALKDQAAVIARSGMAPRSANTPEKVLVIALKARELALPPMVGLSHIYVVEGKPTLSAEIMAALVHRAGHRLRVTETTAEKCAVEGERLDDPGHPQRVEWTMDDAKRAGVEGKGPWKSYPAAMLRARAISALCRFAFADVLMGAAFTPEELGAEVNEEGEVLNVEPQVQDQGESRVQNAEVVEQEAEDLAQFDTEHEDELNQINQLIVQFPAEYFDDPKQIISYAEQDHGQAVASRKRLERLLNELRERGTEPESSQGEDADFDEDDLQTVEDIANGTADDQATRPPAGERPARKSQVDLLKTLAVELRGEDGVARLEETVGKPLAELTRVEADDWIGRLTPEEG